MQDESFVAGLHVPDPDGAIPARGGDMSPIRTVGYRPNEVLVRLQNRQLLPAESLEVVPLEATEIGIAGGCGDELLESLTGQIDVIRLEVALGKVNLGDVAQVLAAIPCFAGAL